MVDEKGVIGRLSLALGALCVVAACGGGTAASPDTAAPTSTSTTVASTASTTTTTTPSTTTTMPEGVLLGAYVEPRGEFTDAERREAVLAHEEMIGRRLGLVNEFFAFDKPWSMERLRWHLDSGRELMVSWNGTHADDILSGRVDDAIAERARWASELGRPFLLRWFWEPDASKGDRWGYHDDPTRYHDAWRHVRAIFEDAGATNAIWVWTPTTWHFVTGNAPAFYPGDEVVDMIGADGYLWSPCQGGVETASDVFGPFLEWASARDKPIVIAEWGADADQGAGSKATFIQEMHRLMGSLDQLAALVVFDAVDPGGRGCDWRIDSSPEALAAYVELATDPAFAGSGLPSP